MKRKRTVDPAACRVSGPPRRFPTGYTPVIRPGHRRQDAADTGIEFGILRLRPNQRHDATPDRETVWVLLDGEMRWRDAERTHVARRRSLFDEAPAAYHVGKGNAVTLAAGRTGAELAVIRSPNVARLPARFYDPADVMNEDRGAGLVQGACRRCVRTVFDHQNRPDSHLVVGEVVNYPGRWSSYPPHHHPQPEIYHYRFTDPRGYGHAELGDDVLKVRPGDTVGIPGGLDHAQVSAPGYGMYYLWVVRHLPRRPYKGFQYTSDHTWLLDPQRQGWQPKLPRTP